MWGKLVECNTPLPITLKSGYPHVLPYQKCLILYFARLHSLVTYHQDGYTSHFGRAQVLYNTWFPAQLLRATFSLSKLFCFGQGIPQSCSYLPFNSGSQREDETCLREIFALQVNCQVCIFKVKVLHMCALALISWQEEETLPHFGRLGPFFFGRLPSSTAT